MYRPSAAYPPAQISERVRTPFQVVVGAVHRGSKYDQIGIDFLRLGRCEIRLKLLALNPSRASSSSVKQHGGQTNILCAFRADVDGAGR